MDYIYSLVYSNEGAMLLSTICQHYTTSMMGTINADVNLFLNPWAERNTWGKLFVNPNSDLVNAYISFVENHPISHIRVSEDSKLYKEMFANLLVQRTELYNRLCREEFVRLIMSESDFNADIDKECRALFDVFKANDENRFRLMNRCFVAGAIVLM